LPPRLRENSYAKQGFITQLCAIRTAIRYFAPAACLADHAGGANPAQGPNRDPLSADPGISRHGASV
jgi:hypothetical protein